MWEYAQCTCYKKCTNDEVTHNIRNIENKFSGGPETIWLLSLADWRKIPH